MQAWVMELLGPYLVPHETPGQEGFYSVREAGLRELAMVQDRPLREVMLACLDEGIWPERFRPNRGTLTASDQARLLRSSVAVIGAGGLGGMVILQLARLGVGRLIVCDGDVFEESNLNRQFLATRESLGQGKARAAALAVESVNPVVEVRVHGVWAYEDNLPAILSDAQVVVDCLDTLATRYIVEEACRQAGLPFVHGAVGGLEGMVMTVRNGDPGLAGLYGQEPAPKAEAAESYLGVPTPTPAMIATLQVAEAVKLLLGWPGLGRGQVLHVDLGVPSIDVLQLG
ncbi:MAG: HesA/MoeB/ThiF family protein [Desulfarculus sp.]|nr:HesA/MoeB/ThiF family protein [Desulfarculus sp.]